MVQAQVKNDGDLYIGDNSVISIGDESFDFGVGVITTSRTELEYGALSFSDVASWKGADDAHFVDGYAQTYSSSAFILPIGQSNIFAPIQVIPSNSEGVDAAYFRLTPHSIGSVVDESILSISSVEYWDINSTGASATISLCWSSSSAISSLTSVSLSNLTIVGWNGSKWVVIASLVDEYSILGSISSLVSGSISSNETVDLSAYSAFSLGTTTATKQLQVPDFDTVELIAYANKNKLFISASLPITALIVYDIMGKVILSEHLNGALKHELPFYHAEEVYVVKIELENSTSLITKKIINKN
jgi:hypothetical protein